MCSIDLMRIRIAELIRDYPYNEYWYTKLTNSVLGMELFFGEKISPDDITRKKIIPEEIWIVSAEELNFAEAKTLLAELPENALFPVTVVRTENMNLLYMGSLRSLCFTWRQGFVDAIVVNVPGAKDSYFFKHKVCTLREYMDTHLV